MRCVLVLMIVSGLFAKLRRDFLVPKHQGKKLVDWVSDLSFEDERDSAVLISIETQAKHDAAVKAICLIGTNALPLALKLCAAENSAMELRLMNWCGDFNAWQKSYHIDSDVTSSETLWHNGLNIFRVLGSNASPAIPTLVGYINHPDSAAAGNASSAFRYIGTNCIPSLLVALADTNKNVAQLAAYSLGHFGTNSISATPLLVRYIQTENGDLADMAAYSLTKINDDPIVVVPVLTYHIKTKASPFSRVVVQKLGSFGTNADSAVPLLVEIIRSNTWLTLIPSAISALEQIDPEKGSFYRSTDGVPSTDSTNRPKLFRREVKEQ